MNHEYIQEKEIVGLSCALHRTRDIFCYYCAGNRMGDVFGHLPDLCWNIPDQVLNKKDKKRVTAPLITLLSVLCLILSI